MDYDQQKQYILTEFYNTQRQTLKLKIDSICFKNFITRNSRIAEDIEAEVYLALSKYNAEKFCKAYQVSKKSIMALAVTIAKRQFRMRKHSPDNPNNSFGTKLLHASTFRDYTSISPTEEYSGDDQFNFTNYVLYDGDMYEHLNYTEDRWQLILDRLTEKEKQFLDDLMTGKKLYKRKPTNEFKAFREYVFLKIRNMDLNKPLTKIELIQTKLDMAENRLFDIIFDEDLILKEKLKILKFSESKYLSQRRILLKKIKMITG